MDIRGRLLKGAIWITGARAISNLLGVATSIALARLLLPDDFGLVALGGTMLAVLAAMTEISLTEALVQLRDPTENHFHAAFTLTVGRAVLIALIFGAISVPVAHLYKDPRLIDVMLVLR
jgi:PST family polysaccharide transporter